MTTSVLLSNMQMLKNPSALQNSIWAQAFINGSIKKFGADSNMSEPP